MVNAITWYSGGRCVQIHLRYSAVTREVVDKAHAHGIAVMAWFTGRMHETDDDFQRLTDAGVDHICTNLPDKLARVCLAVPVCLCVSVSACANMSLILGC